MSVIQLCVLTSMFRFSEIRVAWTVISTSSFFVYKNCTCLFVLTFASLSGITKCPSPLFRSTLSSLRICTRPVDNRGSSVPAEQMATRCRTSDSHSKAMSTQALSRQKNCSTEAEPTCGLLQKNGEKKADSRFQVPLLSGLKTLRCPIQRNFDSAARETLIEATVSFKMPQVCV